MRLVTNLDKINVIGHEQRLSDLNDLKRSMPPTLLVFMNTLPLKDIKVYIHVSAE